jgi:hypothetical protein
MNRVLSINLCGFVLSLIFAPQIEYVDKNVSFVVQTVHAQEVDPIQEIQEFIATGQANVKKAKSRKYRSKRKTKQRIAIYFDALKSFSSALRRLNEYQIEDDQLFEQIESSFESVLSVKEVKKKISALEGKLMTALKTKDFETANQTAQDLIDIDERRETIKYLLPVISEILSNE